MSESSHDMLLTVNTFSAVWIPRDYLAGAGLFSGCFHPTAILKSE